MPKRSVSSFIVWPTCMFIVLTAMGQPAPSGGDSNENLPRLLKPIPPKEPADALNSFEVIDGFHMELVAHEPMVFDPVSGAFDEDGRLYITELLDYPYRPGPGAEPRGRVRLLEDTDGDGVLDRDEKKTARKARRHRNRGHRQDRQHRGDRQPRAVAGSEA